MYSPKRRGDNRWGPTQTIEETQKIIKWEKPHVFLFNGEPYVEKKINPSSSRHKGKQLVTTPIFKPLPGENKGPKIDGTFSTVPFKLKKTGAESDKEPKCFKSEPFEKTFNKSAVKRGFGSSAAIVREREIFDPKTVDFMSNQINKENYSLEQLQTGLKRNSGDDQWKKLPQRAQTAMDYRRPFLRQKMGTVSFYDRVHSIDIGPQRTYFNRDGTTNCDYGNFGAFQAKKSEYARISRTKEFICNGHLSQPKMNKHYYAVPTSI